MFDPDSKNKPPVPSRLFRPCGPNSVQDMAMIERHLNLTDASMQTEVHPVESYIDNNYEWNEWELRKKALKLVGEMSV